MTDVLGKKGQIHFYCEKCDHECSSQWKFDRHVLTRKHKNVDKCLHKKAKKASDYFCECGKIYSHRQSLFVHKKKCTYNEIHFSKPIDQTIIFELLQQNNTLQKHLIELSKEKSIITNNNYNNKTFNLQIFLNETCKDALNISDFVSSLHLRLGDLENTGQNGFVESISNIFIKGLKELEVTKRPVHCSDIKRETLYIKEQDRWGKEKKEKEKIKDAIKQIAHQNIKQIPNWVMQNPECKNIGSSKNDTYLQIINQSMGGADDANYQKIIHNISKEVIIQNKN